jgi:hypothetical protein
VGLTISVPPVACRVSELPSVLVTVTWVAFVAVTVNVEELPEVMDVGLAVMVTVGVVVVAAATVTVAVAVALPPGPVAVAV